MTEINLQEHTLFDFEINEAIYLKFWAFGSFRGHHYKLKRKLVLAALFIAGPSVLIFDLVYYGILYGNFLYVLDFFDWLIALIPLVLAGYVLSLYFQGGKRNLKKFPHILSHVSYDFGPESFTYSSISALSSGTATIAYGQLDVAYETESSFYLLAKGRGVYLIEKSSLIAGNLTTFRLVLQRNLKKKYVLCR